MAEKIKRMRQKYGSDGQWITTDPILAESEMSFRRGMSGWENGKVGDGIASWSALDVSDELILDAIPKSLGFNDNRSSGNYTVVESDRALMLIIDGVLIIPSGLPPGFKCSVVNSLSILTGLYIAEEYTTVLGRPGAVISEEGIINIKVVDSSTVIVTGATVQGPSVTFGTSLDLDPEIQKTGVPVSWIHSDGTTIVANNNPTVLDGLKSGRWAIVADDYSEVTVLELPEDTATALDGLSVLTSLDDLRCNDNDINTLDVALLTLLTVVKCHRNNISILDVSALTLLTLLECDKNNISILDVSALTLLTDLSCDINNISVLNVSALTLLTVLRCDINNISVLNVSALTLLTFLRCEDNNISILDVSALTLLDTLRCEDNNISILDVSALTLLDTLRCDINNISVLNVSALTLLTFLRCEDNNISILDVSALTLLDTLRCDDNASLNVDTVVADIYANKFPVLSDIVVSMGGSCPSVSPASELLILEMLGDGTADSWTRNVS